MSRHLFVAGILALSVVAFCHAQLTPSDFDFNTPVPRGEFVTLRYNNDAPLTKLSLALLDTAGERIQSTTGFSYRERDGTMRWVAMLGIPSVTAAGTYRLVATATRGLSSKTVALDLEVSDRSFTREVIPLSTLLTGIRADPDPRKEEQSRRYAELINSVTPHAVFSRGALRLPSGSRRITSEFGDRRVYQYDDGSEGHAVHNGIDYGAPTGSPVYAAAAGQVRMAEERIVTGNTVVIEHLPGVMTVYFHLHALHVTVGDVMRRGQQVGTVGSTGLSTGAHLHWELRVGGVAVDPARYLTRPLLDTP